MVKKTESNELRGNWLKKNVPSDLLSAAEIENYKSRKELAHYYNLPNEYTRGKAFIWDEIGVGAYAENHSEKVVKWLARAGQLFDSCTVPGKYLFWGRCIFKRSKSKMIEHGTHTNE